ncbi:MAG: hypothetical protein RSF37_02175 [Clostridium sp.]|uniref:hypothetical protein n=1 Tax=Clostridium sp. TaxID=1506 RepID=UPI002FCB87E8
MNKKTLWISVVAVLCIIGISTGITINKNKSNKIEGESWVAYFAPSYTDIVYDKDKAQVVQFDTLGNIAVKDEKAYAFSGIVNYKDNIIYQTTEGLTTFQSKENEMNLIKDKNTVGYDMSDMIDNKDLFYFLLNESLKEDHYSSNIIIGNEENQTMHQLEGFINGYGDDENNIYLLTSDMKNKYLKQVQKISVDSQDNISIKKNDIKFDTILDSNNKMIIVDGYIYSFVVKEHYGISVLKISSETLELENIIDIVKFDSESENDKYYPISANSIFYKDGKIYYPMLSGNIYSFNIKTNEFIEEFTIKDYTFESDSNIISYYDYDKAEMYFLYYEKESDKYCLTSYSLDGSLKNKFTLDKLKLTNNMYPHSFIKVNK